jgi:peptidyl-prolyl cis-trans isomerase B (cyclophilin B)
VALSSDAWRSGPAISTAAPRTSTNVAAVVAVVLAVLCAPLGIIVGHFAWWQVSRRRQPGRRLAAIALFIGYTVIAIPVVLYVTVAVVFVAADAMHTHHGHHTAAVIAP